MDAGGVVFRARPARGLALAALFAAVAAVAVMVLSAACSRKPKAGRVLVLGLDGMDPQTIDLLMSEGKLPSFAKLRQDGAYAPLLSAEPLLSPVIWTTIATGKTPDQHRIGHFVAVSQTGDQLPVTSQMRHVKALWNILSDRGRSVAAVGWWATWPAETVHGSIVSDHFAYHFLFEEGLHGDPNTAGKTYPPELGKSLAPLVKRPQDLTLAEAAPFVKLTPEEFAHPFDLQDDLSEFKWALSTAITYRNVGLSLWKKDRPDTMMVYIEGTDSTAHLFGHLFRAGTLSGDLAEQQKRYGGTVEAMYLYADRLLGDFIAAMDKETTLVVLSDHGFELGRLPDDPSKLRDMRRVSEKYHRLSGILYLYGRGVKGHRRIANPTILDIAPTILALNGVPPAADMPGRVLTDAVEVSDLPRVGSYEAGGVKTASTGTARDSRVDPEMMKRLQSLGYLQPTSPSGDRNIAAILFEQGKYAESAAAYVKLVKEKPDDGALHASLAGALGALGRFDDALRELDAAIRIQPLNPEAYHNRAVIHERRGERDAAIADYRTAVRYSPGYEASASALARLGASPAPDIAKSPEEARARTLSEEASGAARRGDYAAAMKGLDEAEKLAPKLTLIYQYRSNVAYLMGDKKRAIAALKRGLQLEPDNVLFKENIKKLESPSPR